MKDLFYFIRRSTVFEQAEQLMPTTLIYCVHHGDVVEESRN